MKPAFLILKRNHYSSDPTEPSYASGEAVYAEIGYDLDDLMKEDTRYANTCATRMSLALVKSGVVLSGRRKIKKGPFKGRLFETGAKLLADELAKPGVFGRPHLFLDPRKSVSSLTGKQGLVFFWKIVGYDGGHIDLIEAGSPASISVCHSHCYFDCKEVWFWPLS